MTTRIKICGITRVDDALTAARLGADAIGFVFYRASPRYVEPERARDICAALPPFVSTVGLFVDADPAEVDAVRDRVPLSLLQFHGDETSAYCERFRAPYLKAIRVRPGTDLLQCATDFAGARGLLLDAYVPSVPGGTGQRFDWDLVPRGLPLPVVLSGGLDADNVAEAIRRVAPWAVDVSSGVEASKGVKDAGKIARFIAGARNEDLRSA
jgi:phosphoribosylanthranilate isomerase